MSYYEAFLYLRCVYSALIQTTNGEWKFTQFRYYCALLMSTNLWLLSKICEAKEWKKVLWTFLNKKCCKNDQEYKDWNGKHKKIIYWPLHLKDEHVSKKKDDDDLWEFLSSSHAMFTYHIYVNKQKMQNKTKQNGRRIELKRNICGRVWTYFFIMYVYKYGLTLWLFVYIVDIQKKNVGQIEFFSLLFLLARVSCFCCLFFVVIANAAETDSNIFSPHSAYST